MVRHWFVVRRRDSSGQGLLVGTDVMWAELAGFVGIIGTGLVGYFFTVRQKIIEDRRTACARAIADVLAWRELPYRVRRRRDNEVSTRTELVERIHGLQESINYHENWLRIEIPEAQPEFASLVRRVKETVAEPLQAAWEDEPVSSAAGMNLGDLTLPSVDSEVEAFAKAARSQLAWWRFWK
jgi:hypothetical protein